jgi:hypothetical protein
MGRDNMVGVFGQTQVASTWHGGLRLYEDQALSIDQ